MWWAQASPPRRQLVTSLNTEDVDGGVSWILFWHIQCFSVKESDTLPSPQKHHVILAGTREFCGSHVQSWTSEPDTKNAGLCWNWAEETQSLQTAGTGTADNPSYRPKGRTTRAKSKMRLHVFRCEERLRFASRYWVLHLFPPHARKVTQFALQGASLGLTECSLVRGHKCCLNLFDASCPELKGNRRNNSSFCVTKVVLFLQGIVWTRQSCTVRDLHTTPSGQAHRKKTEYIHGRSRYRTCKIWAYIQQSPQLSHTFT